MSELAYQLKQRVKALSLDLEEKQIGQLIDYLTLLHKWNKTYNLSAVRHIDDMLERHLVDSLSVLPHIKGKSLLDVGTGPGLPGIPLAICFPDKKISLLDSNGKKTRFLHQVKLSLKLTNIEIFNERVESLPSDHRFEAIISRAFSSLNDMLEKTNHLIAPKGVWYAMKGLYPRDELDAVNLPYVVESLDWPGNDKARHLVVIQS